MRSEQIRYGCAEPDRTHPPDRFAVWGWTGWVWGIAPWLIVLYYAYPLVWAVYHGKLAPLPPGLWVLRGLYFVFVFILVPAWALYAGWVFFSVLRIAADRITVGRWFGARQRVYRASDVGGWRLVDRRSRTVAEARAASMLRIDFLDGSWVGIPRRAWNFRNLTEWLRRWAASVAYADARIPNEPPRAYRFVVRQPGMVLLVLAGWGVGWMVGALSITETLSGRFGPPSGLGGVAWYAFGLVIMGLVPLIAGPLCAHFLLQDIRVNAQRIQVDRWFGLVRRTYHEDDIKTWRVRVDSDPPRRRQARDSSLLIRFADGASIFVTERATNFRPLYDYLRGRAAARQDAPHGGDRSGIES